jgi:transposase
MEKFILSQIECKCYYEIILSLAEEYGLTIEQATLEANKYKNSMRLRGRNYREAGAEVVANLMNSGLVRKQISSLLGITPEQVAYFKNTNRKLFNGVECEKVTVGRPSQRETKAKKIAELIDKEYTLDEIAKELRVSNQTIINYIHMFDLKEPVGIRKHDNTAKVEEIKRLINQGYSVPQIARYLGESRQAVYQFCDRYDLRINRQHISIKQDVVKLTKQGYTLREISEILNVSYYSVYNTAEYYGIKKNKVSSVEKEAIKELYRMRETEEYKDMQISEIVEHLGIKSSAYYKIINNDPVLRETFKTRERMPFSELSKRVLELDAQGLTKNEIAKELNKSEQCIIACCSRIKQTGMSSEIKDNWRKKRDKYKNVVELMCEKGFKVARIAKTLGIAEMTVKRIIKENGLTRN